MYSKINPVSANHTKWSNTLKQFVNNSRLIVGLAPKGLVTPSV